jgi:hypothetical protein
VGGKNEIVNVFDGTFFEKEIHTRRLENGSVDTEIIWQMKQFISKPRQLCKIERGEKMTGRGE